MRRIADLNPGSSIRGEHPARSGSRKLKRALFLAALAALSDRLSQNPQTQSSGRS